MLVQPDRVHHKRIDLVNSEGELDGIAILF